MSDEQEAVIRPMPDDFRPDVRQWTSPEFCGRWVESVTGYGGSPINLAIGYQLYDNVPQDIEVGDQLLREALWLSLEYCRLDAEGQPHGRINRLLKRGIDYAMWRPRGAPPYFSSRISGAARPGSVHGAIAAEVFDGSINRTPDLMSLVRAVSRGLR